MYYIAEKHIFWWRFCRELSLLRRYIVDYYQHALIHNTTICSSVRTDTKTESTHYG